MRVPGTSKCADACGIDKRAAPGTLSQSEVAMRQGWLVVVAVVAGCGLHSGPGNPGGHGGTGGSAGSFAGAAGFGGSGGFAVDAGSAGSGGAAAPSLSQCIASVTMPAVVGV
jgi:hypothetical protein